MSINKFIQPLFDFPTSSIINEIENKSYSYQEFYTEILRIEYEFENLRIEKNSIVVIYGYRSSFKTLMLFFFCIKNDLIPFIVEQGNLSYIDDLNFNILITTESLIFKKEREIKKTEFEFCKVYQNFHKDLYYGSSNNFAIVSSSGSTSKVTKKILLGKKETLNNIKSNQKALSLTDNDTTLVLLPISYSYGLIAQFLSHFLLGSDIVLTDKTLGIIQIPSLLKKYNITNLFMTPLMSRLFFHYNKKINTVKNNLNFITIGGDKPNKEGVEKIQNVFQCPIYSTYGLAEAGPRVATKKVNLNDVLTFELGNPNPGIKINIIENEKYQKLCGTDQVGYLNIETPSIYLGYIIGKTLQKPISKNVLKTKDICVKDNEGMQLLGRDGDYIIKKDKIIWFYEIGNNFYKNLNVLKVKIKKETQNKLNIMVYHRNQITTNDFSKTLLNKYGLTKNLEYSINLVEFNNSQYK